jgi:OTU domain-containing protein 6
MSSKEEIESAYKKALKTLEGEKRAAVKKAKALKGKKGKDALAAVETEFEEKNKKIIVEYEEKLASVAVASLTIVDDAQNQSIMTNASTAATEPSVSDNQVVAPPSESGVDEEALARERKLAKARKKKEKQKEKEREMEEQIELETANAGPSRRQIELQNIQNILSPLNLKVAEVEADGHCLYRAVGAQIGKPYTEIRSLCADALEANREELAAFCEYSDTVSSFEDYVEMVRSSAEWGGHVEIRALSMVLDRPIHIYSVQQGKDPLVVHEESASDPILLSYHLHYYALGEHYNQVVPVEA